MRTGGKLFKFVAALMLDKFHGTATIRFQGAKVTRVELETRRTWQYKDLPEDVSQHSCAAAERQTAPGQQANQEESCRLR